MRVRCVDIYPSEEQLKILGPDFYMGQFFGVRRGREYLVLAMRLPVGGIFGRAPLVEFKNEDDQPGWAPLLLFEIIDPRPSRYWEVHAYDNGEVVVSPPSFRREYYMEDYYERVRGVVENFERVCRLLEIEAEQQDLELTYLDVPPPQPPPGS